MNVHAEHEHDRNLFYDGECNACGCLFLEREHTMGRCTTDIARLVAEHGQR